MTSLKHSYRIILFAAAAVIITLIIPRRGLYMQNFAMGEIWRSETLTAPFDFAVNRTRAEIVKEKRSIADQFIPVYSFDSTDTSSFAPELREKLNFIYKKGVAANLDKRSATDTTGMSYIRIKRNSILTTISTAEVFTGETAKKYLGNDTITITPNIRYNEALNALLREREENNIPTTSGLVRENDLIISNKQIIDKDVFEKLSSLKIEYEKRLGVADSYIWLLAGHFLLVLIVMTITYLFLYYFKSDFINSLSNVLFILLLYVLMTIICSVVVSNNISVYIIPFAIVPIYILTFYDVRMSIFEHTTVLLLCSLIVPYPIEFFFINFVAGIVGVFVLKHSYRREKIFMATGAIFVINCISYIAMSMVHGGMLSQTDFITMIWFGVGALLFLGMYQLIYVIERIFGFVSDTTLLELCDTNQKLLSELARKAPGTFHHTIQVANLAEAAAKEIGANPLLARTGALYHDIGKMLNPAYFIENTTSSFNPHNSISPKESAAIIRKHVTDGIVLARKAKLPEKIIEFITGHHGDSLIYYFYVAQKEKSPEDLNPSEFSYPGPRPLSKEASICMMADSIEAASRTLQSYTKEAVAELVNRIIDTQLKDRQLSGSKLSISNITAIKEVFTNNLYNTYHTRITYPERD